jgi:hypothetical protein
MIKNHYMIYDWVYVNNTPFQVQSLTKKKIGYHRTPTTMSYARLSEVEPIPITEEFLLCNGFELKDEYQGYKQYYNFNDKVGIDFSDAQFYVVVNGNVRVLKYIHEIQHMYDWQMIEKVWKINFFEKNEKIFW